MKKYFLLALVLLSSMFFVGCGKYGEKDVLKDLTKNIENVKSYHLAGELEIVNNEDSFLYDVDVAFEKDNNFRVSLKNKTNNHEQIILRNGGEVYVLTPSLNKSFKFQSEWPYNNSQSYLLQTILKDIKGDTNRTFKETDSGYMFTTVVNYSSNRELVKQNVYLDKDLNVKEVHVMNDKDQVMMKMKFNQMDLKATFEKNYFALNSNMTNAGTDTTTGSLEDIVYPMYIPANTSLSGQDRVTKENGERIILTFSGEKPFMFVQETVTPTEDMLTIPMYGEPDFLTGTVGAVSDSSVSWISDGIEYYLVSDVLTKDELLKIAKSVSVQPVAVK